jgi:rubrerythrin
MEIGGDALTQRPADAGAAVFRVGRESARVGAPEVRRELRCPGCGFGAIVAGPLARCPMCGRGDWQLIRALPAAAAAEVVRW